ncbi:MAG TPA: EAL domain-containing protein [Geminicoccaceae bacterium]|nr:EAL domain-containing protein [Geminicoccus sp.]HMU50950.1 EAL domain-containing protein [Geminicoccaceae bacterium]
MPLLLILAVLGLAVPTAVTAALVWAQGEAADELVHEQEGRLLARDAARLADRIRALAEPSEGDLLFVAGLAKADILTSDDLGSVERFLFERARTRTWIRSIFLLLERNGDFILIRPHGDSGWQSIRQHGGGGRDLEIRDLDDAFNETARTMWPASEFDLRQRPWYRIVSDDGRPTWTSPFVLFPSGLPGISVVAPILAADGSRTGIVGASIQLSEADRFLQSLIDDEQTGVAVIDREGNVIASASKRAAGSGRPDPAGELALQATRRDAWKSKPYLLAEAGGERRLVSVAAIRNPVDQGLAMVHAPAGSTLHAFVTSERSTVLAIAAAFVLAATSVTWLVWRWVERPLAAAGRFAAAQAAGGPLPALHAGPLAEVRVLAGSLAAMSREIEARRAREDGLRDSLVASNARQEALLASAPLAVVELRCDGSGHRIAGWLGRSTALFGRDAAGAVGGDLVERGVVPATAAADLESLVRRCLDGGWAEATLPFLNGAGESRTGQWYASRIGADSAGSTVLLLVHDETERAQAAVVIQRMAREDALTGLANRSRFLDLLEQALGQASRRREQLAVWALDLDDFKGINDAYGHGEGDEVLRQLGGRLRRLVRSSDAVARFGGDEFVLMQTEVGDESHVEAFGHRLRATLAEPVAVADRALAVSCGVGVALFPTDGPAASDLLRRADLALLAAKREGRGQLRAFVPELETARAERRGVEERLRRAIRQGELELAFQPICEIAATPRIVAAEALARWNDNGVSVSPGVFVPLAEETDLIHELGELVVRLGARQLRRWTAEGFTLPLSINLSPAQLRRTGFADRLVAAMADSGAASDLLHLELTESLFLESGEALVQLRRLQDTGFGLAIDDFGTGYANLASLVRLRPRWLKIDRSFIAGMTTDPRSMTITRAVIDLARSLGMDAVAEGVETEAQLEILRSIRCPLAQGFLLGRPCPPEALRAA